MDTAKTIVADDRVHRPVLDENVTPEDWKKAREELNETPEVRAASLKAFKERLKNQEDFIPRTDDIYLLRFLRVRKFNLENAYNLMRDYYKFRAKHPTVFPSPSSNEKALRANIFNYLPHRDHMGRAIFISKIELWDPEEVPYCDHLAAGNIISEFLLDNPVTQINGFIGIWDCKGFSLKQFKPLCSYKNLLLLQSLMQDRFPGRFKVAYLVNCHPLVNTAWNICKPILKEKLKHRIKILGSDMSALHQYVDPSILPEEYGGQMPRSDCESIVRLVMGQEEYFNYDRKFGFQSTDSHS